MRIEPDYAEARIEKLALERAAQRILTTLHLKAAPAAGAPAIPHPSYPGWYAHVHRWQRQPELLGIGMEQEAAGAIASSRRSHLMPGDWRVDLTGGEPYLELSLARALGQVEATGSYPGERKLHLGMWEAEDRLAFRRAAALLQTVWPQMLEEMSITVEQVALVRGFGIDGFTDFTCHGAIFVNERRLAPSSQGLPGDVHLAEALVHEATHTRCNGAAYRHGLLAAHTDYSETLVPTPLRRDLRPVGALVQQLAVLARCVVLYDRVTDASRFPAEAVVLRAVRLREHATSAIKTLQAHRHRLSDAGSELLDGARRMLAETARPSGP